MTEHKTLMTSFPAATGQQVEIDNMQLPPFNRWAFPQMRRLLPTANIWRGNGAVMALKANAVDISQVVFMDSTNQPCPVKNLICDNYTDSFVVLKAGDIVCEQYRTGLTPNEPSLLMSVSKSLIGSLCGILVEQGKLSPDDLVTDILPEVSGSAYDQAQVRHVLDMTVGIDFQ